MCEHDLVDRLERELAMLKSEQERPYDLSLSFGEVSVAADEGLSFEDAVERADARMYEVKRLRKMGR